jgi:cytochrome c-type biogenesis protein CcmH/NrfG
MKLESVIYGIAGIFFGLITGWIIGSQQALMTPRANVPVAESAPPAQSGNPPGSAPGTPAPAILDDSQVQALRTVVDRDPKNAVARAQLGNLYYDAGRFTDAIKWYTESLALNPKDASVSTDLGVSYYYNNQPDLAIKQLEHSLQVDPKHTKALLNMGVVRAFGKQDLKGATEIWRRLVEIAPESPEGRQARQALESLSTAHENVQ